jgi:2-polyprenyl-6-methoxyphenol hydroxylase-like FAD-dependent oxidoreductase
VRSRIAGWVGAAVTERFLADVTTFSTYVGDVDWRGFEFHLADESFAGVFPTHHGEASVWVSRPTDQLRDVRSAGSRRDAAFVAQLDVVAPHLAERVRRGRIREPVRGVVRLPNLLRVPAGPGWALVGDAAYHRDPITGHGITDAFRDAELLAAGLDGAMRDGSPEAEARAGLTYQRTRDAAARDTFRLTRQIASFPTPSRMAELQIEYAAALDAEAHDLAALPAPPGAAAA